MRNFIALIIVVCLLSLAQPAKSFIEFEKFLIPFQKKHVQTVRIINHPDAPIEILSAKVADKGSEKTKTLKGIFNDFSVKVKNTSGKDVMSYRVAWTLKLPFQNWVDQRTELNSIDVIHAGQEQSIGFKKDKYYRDDAYYYVEIVEVQFNDEEIWKAPEVEETLTRDDKVKQDIESIQEKSIDDMSLDEIKEQMQKTTNGAALTK